MFTKEALNMMTSQLIILQIITLQHLFINTTFMIYVVIQIDLFDFQCT